MHDAVVADAVQQQLQSNTAAETDVRGERAARNLRGVNGGRAGRPPWTTTACAVTSCIHHDAHRTSRRVAHPIAFLIRSETYSEKKTLKMSSRSRVSVELVMRHRPSIFS